MASGASRRSYVAVFRTGDEETRLLRLAGRGRLIVDSIPGNQPYYHDSRCGNRSSYSRSGGRAQFPLCADYAYSYLTVRPTIPSGSPTVDTPAAIIALRSTAAVVSEVL